MLAGFISIYQGGKRVKGGKKSLPDYERQTLRAPGSLIRRFMLNTS